VRATLGDHAAGVVGERAPLATRAPYEPPAAATTTTAVAVPAPEEHFLGELRLVRYSPLFSGPVVERVEELDFLRAAAEIGRVTKPTPNVASEAIRLAVGSVDGKNALPI
jgi:hypothetical protein